MQLRPLFSHRPSADSSSRDPYDDMWWGPISRPTAAGVSVTIQRALNLPVVYDATKNNLADTIGALPFAVFARQPEGAKLRRDDHPLMRALRDPNPETTDAEFIGQLVFDLATEGNAFTELRGGALGPITELWRHDPSQCTVERLSDGSKRYVIKLDNGQEKRFTEDQIWHIKVTPHTEGGLRGMSPILGAGRDAVAVAIAVQDYAARFFNNDCTPPFVLEHPNFFADQPSRDTFLQAIKKWWGGKRRHSPGLLEYGIKLNRVGVNNDEAQFLETKNAADHALARIWRMPPHKVGLLDKATNNNIEQQALEYVTDTLLPWLRLIEKSVMKFLLLGSDRERFIFEFNVMGLLRGDAKSRFMAYSLGRQWGWLSVNEIRALENMNPIGPAGDRYLTPLNMVPVGSIPRDADGMPQDQQQRDADRLINGPRNVIYGPQGNAVSAVVNGNVVRLEQYRHAA